MTHQPTSLALSRPALSRMARHRRAFRDGCTMALALALAGNAGTAAAQSFQATPDVVNAGTASIFAEGTETFVTVNAEQAIINWNLESSTIAGNPPVIFQPEGTTATFEAGSGVNSFTVLNRILPYEVVGGEATVPVNRTAQFNGTVNSPANSSIWFYSPAGIVIGASAEFNVGNLVLTSNDIDFSDGGLFGPDGAIRFRGGASSLAPVEIHPGAALNTAGGTGSYLAIVAPRIVQGGSINADGHVALVAAEQADIRINAGLLDIMVTQGTTDPNGIVHTGTSGGGASDDVRVMSLVAIPKNTALTMLLSGSIGYAPAASAIDEGGSVVLSAGYADYLPNDTLARNLGSIDIGNTQFTSPVAGTATNAIDIAPVGGTTAFDQGARLTAFQSISAIAGDGESITSDQALFLRSNQGLTGGVIALRAEGGTTGGEITATGGLYLTANGAEDTILFPESGESLLGTGGTISLTAAGGTIAADQISLEASGFGLTDPASDGLFGGDGVGGSVTALVSGEGSITTPNFSAEASGYGASAIDSSGDGAGGTVALQDQGGTLDIGNVHLTANGFGGFYAAQNGDAQSGSVMIDIAGGTQTWTDLYAEAGATGGESYMQPGGPGTATSGSATGRADAISLHVGSGAALNITGDLYLVANAYAGTDGDGNTATAGGIDLLVDGGAALQIGNALSATADATVSGESLFAGPLTTPTVTGGTVSILADSGTITVHDLLARASATGGGAADTAGTATGGTSTVGAANGGSISTFAAFGAPGQLTVDASAYGGNGPSPADAFGGNATLYVDGGTLNLDDTARVQANATSGELTALTSGTGFAAQGGTASLELRSGGGSVTAAGLQITADGDATSLGSFGALEGNGRSGTGGTARLSVAAGTLVADEVTIQATGSGGQAGPFDAAPPLQSGDGFGGTASLTTTGGSLAINTALQLLAQGFGGGGTETLSGQTAPLSGNGTGGNASMLLSGGSLNTPMLLLDAQGIGGQGGSDFSGVAMPPNGGNGTGGSAQLAMSDGSTAQLTAGNVQITANGLGGAGGDGETGQGNGGTGTGGSAGFDLADGSFTFGPATVQADGIGGAGATGGNGIGGTATFLLNDSLAGTAPRTLASLTLSGSGSGGTSQTGPAATGTAGQVQLTANAGSAANAVSITGDFIAQPLGDIAPDGNGFVASIAGAPFNVGGNSTVTTTGDVSITIDPGGMFATQGVLTITTPRGVMSRGLVSAGSDAAISADLGIVMSDLNSGGTTLLTSSAGPVTISNDLSSTGLVSVFGTSLDISSLGALSFADAQALDGGLAVEAAGDLVIGGIDVTGDVMLASTEGAAQINGPVSGTNVSLSGATGVTAGAITAAGNVDLSSSADTIDVGPISGTDISVLAADDLTTVAVTGTGTVELESGGTLQTTETVSGAGVTLTAAGDVQANADVLSTAALRIQAGDTFRVGARIMGTDIVAESGDIAIAPAANIGERGTTRSIVLNNSDTARPTYIGGASQSAGYSIDQAEAAQLYADDSITFGTANAAPGSVADFIIGDLALSYGSDGQIGSGGLLKILTPDRIEINGAVALTTSSDADRFSIDPTRIDVVTDTGSIVMRDNTGALMGQLELIGGTIAVASAARLEEIANLSNIAEINAALDAPDVAPSDAGYLQAGQILLEAADAIYIANTGVSAANADRRGFTANELSITTGSSTTHISINGVLLDPAGNAVTGLDTAQLVVINGAAGTPGQFAPLSTINGCAIAQDCRGTQRAETTKTKSDIEVPLDPEGSTPEFRYVMEIEEREPEDLQPLVDEPVTGMGNDDLWNGGCGPDSGECPQGGVASEIWGRACWGHATGPDDPAGDVAGLFPSCRRFR